MENRFDRFTILMQSINRSIRRIKTAEVEEYKLKSPHISCLYYLSKHKKMTAKEICDVCGEDKGAMSRSIEYLESQGFISCDSTLNKRYNAHFVLTEKGLETAKGIGAKIDAVLSLSSKGVSEEDLVKMYEVLDVINRNLIIIAKEI